MLALVAVVLALVCASGAGADTVTWGISGVTPSLDTANGDHNSAATPGVVPGSSACPYGITCSPEDNPLSGTNPILPGPFSGEDTANTAHSAEDLGVWNPEKTAPAGGQVLEVKITGCAVEDMSSPSQESQGVPVNTILFQSLTPSGDEWEVDNTAGGENPDGSYPFQLPFCDSEVDSTTVTPSTVTTYQPLHLCLNAGDVVTFHDVGGFVVDGAHYPEGVPMEVLAPVSGVSTDSFIGVGANPLGPGAYGANDDTNESGYATEADQEVTMQVIEGTGNDAYGLCPGGFGDEPAGANTIDCDYHTSADGTNAVNPVQYPDHPFCAGPGEPVPGSNVPPTASAATTTKSPSSETTSKSSSSGAGQQVTAPQLTHLKLNPARFVAWRGSTITYTDSHPGLTTLRFYRVKGHRDVLIKTIRHQDKAKVGVHIGGLGPASYVVRASSVYERLRSPTVTATFKVIARR